MAFTFSLYLHMGCLGDEVDRHPVQHILGPGISKRGHKLWEALAPQQALHLLRDEQTRGRAGQPSGKEEEVRGARLLLPPAVVTASTARVLPPAALLSHSPEGGLFERSQRVSNFENPGWPGR